MAAHRQIASRVEELEKLKLSDSQLIALHRLTNHYLDVRPTKPVEIRGLWEYDLFTHVSETVLGQSADNVESLLRHAHFLGVFTEELEKAKVLGQSDPILRGVLDSFKMHDRDMLIAAKGIQAYADRMSAHHDLAAQGFNVRDTHEELNEARLFLAVKRSIRQLLTPLMKSGYVRRNALYPITGNPRSTEHPIVYYRIPKSRYEAIAEFLRSKGAIKA